MSQLDRYKDKVWDRFFDFISQPIETMSREEVQDELRNRKIDVARAVSKVQQAVAASRARTALEEARAKRPGIVEKLTSVFAASSGELRERIRETISGRLQGTAQAAYFRKLEQAAGEKDLQRLMDDLQRLDALDEEDETTEGTS